MESIEQMFQTTPVDTRSLSTDDIVKEYIRLNSQIKELAERRAEYGAMLTQFALDTRNGQQTIHIEGTSGQRIKVEFKKDFSCDQAEIECAKELLTEERFRQIFKIEYSPKSRNLKSFMNTVSADERVETAKAIIGEAVKEVEKRPYVSVEKS